MTDRPDPEAVSFASPGPGAAPTQGAGGAAAAPPLADASARAAAAPASWAGAPSPLPPSAADDPAAYGARWGAPGGPTPAEQAEARRRTRIWVATMLGVIVLVVALAAGISSATARAHEQAWSPVAAEIEEPASVNAVQLVLGSCLAEMPDGAEVTTVTVVPCSQEHRAQVVGRTDSAAAEVWPGDDVVAARAARVCSADLLGPQARENGAGDGLEFAVWAPSEGSWDDGDRTGLCVARLPGPGTGSLLE